ncbi:MAG TPA: hypothetical protein VHO66_09325 [Ruminiclostridium sp.]|nr:hypothetical protein [Ruminiclostridium sp.]
MLKKSLRIGAFICALATGFAFSGCSDTSWSLKSGNITVPTGVYLYYLINNANEVQNGSYTSSGSVALSSSSSKSSDPWSKTVEGKNAVTWAINKSLDSCKQLLTVEKQAAARKVTITSTEKGYVKTYAQQSYTSSQDIYSKNGISQASIERIYTDAFLEQELFKSYYGEKGDKAVSESDLEKYYTDNYAHVKQIFISKIDTTTNEKLSSDKLATQKTKADEAFAAAKADVGNFQKYVDKYNEDPGMKSNPDGYIFSKSSATSSGYDTKFTDLAFSLKVGEIGMAESDMGYFIEYKVATDPKASTFTSSIKQTILTEMKGTEFQKLINDLVAKEKFTQNDSAINHFNPKKLKLQ